MEKGREGPDSSRRSEGGTRAGMLCGDTATSDTKGEMPIK